ncbi:hypothetical protein OA178_00425 [Candidatus Pelagibacter sp.]|nr:hypothetical protein [Candidatus Pelagibacter sp.]MDC3030224.1 hypothetical protein [Candidatus Pelagibacter sp.]
MTILNRILKGISENIIDRCINITIKFIEPIIFISLASIEIYGTWLVIFSLPAYIMISDLGFSTVGQNQINMNIKLNRFKEAQKNFLNTLNLTIILNIIFSIFFFTILKKLFDIGFLKLEDMSSKEFYSISIIIILYTFIHQLNGLYLGIYPAHNKYYLKIRIGYISRILEICLLFYGLLTNNSFQFILLHFLVFKILIFVFVFIDTNIKYNWIKFHLTLDKDYVKKNLSHAVSYLMFPITNALKYQSTNLIINASLGPKYVALLSIYLTLSRVMVNFTSITDGIIKVEVAKLWVSKQLKNLKKLFIFNVQITFYFSIMIIIFLFFFNETIFKIWIGETFVIEKNLLYILILSTFFQSLFFSSSTLLISTNNFKKITLYNLLNALIFIVCIFVYLKINPNLLTVAILFLISDTIIFINAINFSSKMLNEKVISFFEKIFSFKSFKNSSYKIIENYRK